MPITATAQGKTFTFPDGTSQEQIGSSIDDFFSRQRGPSVEAPQASIASQIEKELVESGVNPEFARRESQRLAIERERSSAVIAGAPEAALSIASSAIAEPIAGLAGLGAPLFGAGAAETVRATRDFLTLAPRSQVGKESLGAVGGLVGSIADLPGQAVGALSDEETRETIKQRGLAGLAGEGVLQATGSPALAAAVETIPTAIAEAIGVAKLSKVAKAAPKKLELPEDVRPIFNRLPEESKIALSQQSPEIAEQALREFQRSETFKTFDIEPTQAQISRDPTLFQEQQELAKVAGPVRSAVEKQEAILTGAFDDVIRDSQGNPVSSGSPQIDSIVDKATSLDQEIGRLYKEAQERSPVDKNVRFNQTSKMLKRASPRDTLAKGVVQALRGEMIQMGVLDRKFKPVGRVSIEQAQELRKVPTLLFPSTNDIGKTILRQFKNALDKDAFSASGQDIFGRAINAKAKFESDLSKSKIHKFDANKRSLVRDMLENKIDPDNFFKKVVAGKTYRSTDLKQLKDYLSTGNSQQVTQGLQAWNDLRAETLDFIKEKSFIGPEDQRGFKSLSKLGFERATEIIGNKRKEKMDVLFNDLEKGFLDDLGEIAKLKEPPRGTALGSGPSAQAIKNIKTLANRLPGVGALLDQIDFRNAGRRVLKLENKLQKIVDKHSKKEKRLLQKASTVLAIPELIGADENGE